MTARKPTTGAMAAIRNTDPSESGFYVDGIRVTNFTGGAVRCDYRPPKDGGMPKWMLDMEFYIPLGDRNDDGAYKEVKIIGEVSLEDFPYPERWLNQMLGNEAAWDAKRPHDVVNVIKKYSEDSDRFTVRPTTSWADAAGTWVKGKLVANYSGTILRERIVEGGETVFDLKITHNGVPRYVTVPFDKLMRGGYESLISGSAKLHDPIAMWMTLYGDHTDRTDGERTALQIEALTAEQTANNERIAAAIAKLRSGVN